MVSELLDKYLWLMQTLVDAGERGLSLEEITSRWTARYGAPYPRRTFNNHRASFWRRRTARGRLTIPTGRG